MSISHSAEVPNSTSGENSPPHLIDDAHEWSNEISTVPTHLETTNKISYGEKAGRKNRREVKNNEEEKVIQKRRENKIQTFVVFKDIRGNREMVDKVKDMKIHEMETSKISGIG